MSSFFVAVHGGAGYHSESSEAEKKVKRGLRRACLKALDSLSDEQSGSRSPLDAVEAAIESMEDDECFNAGFGSNLTVDGTVECDASIMDDKASFGSVGAVSGVKNPITLARSILDYSKRTPKLGRVPPLTLVSSGAYKFATANSLAGRASQLIEPEELVSPRARQEWEHWKGRLESSRDEGQPSKVESYHGMEDTVGAVVAVGPIPGGDTRAELMAAGVSSGGILLKLSGRLGEAGVFGAGCWATSNVAVSVSGTGEYIVRATLAKSIGVAVDRCLSAFADVHEEIERVIGTEFLETSRVRDDEEASAGAIVMVREPIETPNEEQKVRLWCAFTTESMAIGYGFTGHKDDTKSVKICIRLAFRSGPPVPLDFISERVMHVARIPARQARELHILHLVVGLEIMSLPIGSDDPAAHDSSFSPHLKFKGSLPCHQIQDPLPTLSMLRAFVTPKPPSNTSPSNHSLLVRLTLNMATDSFLKDIHSNISTLRLC